MSEPAQSGPAADGVPASRPGGAAVMRLCGEAAVPHVSGALHLPASRTLVVADLHFEKGSAFAARGVHLPPYDTRSTLFRLSRVIEEHRPERVVALGDSFHDGAAASRLDADDAAAIAALTAATDWIWISGNHDPEPPQHLGGRVLDEHDDGTFVFRHIPGAAPATREIAGHLHPVATVSSRGRRLRRRCFVSDGSRIVLPAFGAYTGGLGVGSEPFRGLFAGGAFTAWMIGRERVYPVSSRRLVAGV